MVEIGTSQWAVGQRLQARMAAARRVNPWDNAVIAVPPAVTTTYDASLSTFFTYAANPNCFNFYGGLPTIAYFGTDYAALPIAGTTNYGLTVIEFMTDAPKLQFRCSQGTHLVEIDGAILTKAGTATAVGGGEQQLVFDWTAVRKTRRYRIALAGGSSFVRVGVDSLSRVWAPRAGKRIRATITGDSITSGTGASNIHQGYASVLSMLMGWDDLWLDAESGTGWLAAGSGTTARTRISNVISAAPDIWIGALGKNDSSAGIQAEVAVYLAQLRASLPTTKMVVLGSFPGSTGPSATVLAVEAAISAAVSAFADPYCSFVPVSTDPQGAWIFGTGKVGTTNGSGNSDVYTSADGTHPPDAGHDYLGRYAAEKVGSALAAMQ